MVGAIIYIHLYIVFFCWHWPSWHSGFCGYSAVASCCNIPSKTEIFGQRWITHSICIYWGTATFRFQGWVKIVKSFPSLGVLVSHTLQTTPGLWTCGQQATYFCPHLPFFWQFFPRHDLVVDGRVCKATRDLSPCGGCSPGKCSNQRKTFDESLITVF